MKKYINNSLKVTLFNFLFLIQTGNAIAGAVRCGDDCSPPLGYTRIAANLTQSKKLQTFDVSALNFNIFQV